MWGHVLTSDQDERRRFVASPLGNVKIMVRNLGARVPIPGPKADAHVVDIRAVPKALLVQQELRYTGFERPALWSDEHIFNRKDVQGFAVVAKPKAESVDDLLAWVVTRRCSGGIRIGPLYASDAGSAKAALLAAMNCVTPAEIKKMPLPNEAMNGWSDDRIANDATLVTEVWGANADAVGLFEELGWQDSGVMYHRMWVNGKAPPEQSQGGLSQKGVFAIFDAAVG